MKIAFSILLVLLTALAVLSGVTKITLMPNEVEFFGQYGFSNPMLIAFGAAQLIGGILLPWKKTRFAGAAVVAVTFLVSLAIARFGSEWRWVDSLRRMLPSRTTGGSVRLARIWEALATNPVSITASVLCWLLVMDLLLILRA